MLYFCILDMMDNAPTTYPETLEYLLTQLPMFSRVGMGAFKADLTNIRALCAGLGNPQDHFKSIHIGGTNGKGSVSHMLAAVLRQSGFRTGLYTSPHLKDFRERVRVDGLMITKDFVTGFVRSHFGLIAGIQPSFFEITVALAFEWFRDRGVEVAVVEVGLGGRLDSTNILEPVLSVITNVSYDHQQMLGNTLGAIAGEKAGIMKPGIPVVIGETHPESRDVFARRAVLGKNPLVFADQVREITAVHPGKGTLTLETGLKDRASERDVWSYTLDLTGAYQKKNLLTVLTAVDILQKAGWRIAQKDVALGLSRVRDTTGLRGRWELIGANPRMIADVAHNEAGILEVMDQLASLSFSRLHIVTGFVRDKIIQDILRHLPIDAVYYYTQADISRALPATELREAALAFGLKGTAYPRVAEALLAARAAAGPEDLILVCGSVFVVAEALPE